MVSTMFKKWSENWSPVEQSMSSGWEEMTVDGWGRNWVRNFFIWPQEGTGQKDSAGEGCTLNQGKFIFIHLFIYCLVWDWYIVTKAIKYFLRFKVIMKLGTSFFSLFLVEKYFSKFTFYFLLSTPRKVNHGHIHVFVSILVLTGTYWNSQSDYEKEINLQCYCAEYQNICKWGANLGYSVFALYKTRVQFLSLFKWRNERMYSSSIIEFT